MESPLLKELACAGVLDEVSNVEDGEAIGRYVRGAGAVGGGDQMKKFVFFLVDSGRRMGSDLRW